MCRDAAMITMRRRIAGLKPSEIRSLGREELDVPVTMEDFKEAVKKCKKNVSSEDLEKYKFWMEAFNPLEMGLQVPSRVKKIEVEYICD